MGGPLAGIRVVDLATERAELAGRLLADLGAEVIKVEPPQGARARRFPPLDGERSLYWAAVGLGKRSVVLDIAAPEQRARLRALLTDADVLLESSDPGELESVELGYEALSALNPRLVYVSVTPYGQTGPLARAPASELTIEAAGGLLGLQGDGDRPPIPLGLPQAAFHAGAQAADDAVIALHERERSGRGQHLDVSMQAAVVWTLMHATGLPPNSGGDPPGSGEQRSEGRPPLLPGVEFPSLTRCRDGYIATSIGSGALGPRTMQLTVRWMAEEGAVDEDLVAIDWERLVEDAGEGRLDAATINRCADQIGSFFRRRTKREIFEQAIARGLVLAPIYDVADVRADPQLAARDYWLELGGRTYPGPFARLSRTPLTLERPAPERGADQVLLPEKSGATPKVGGASPSPQGATREGAFAGLKVADFAWVGVGPIISKALADHGATVVHVESGTRPDVLRGIRPFKDDEPGIDRSQFMANFNSSKLGVSLELATEGGRTLARRLCDWADVVTESFRPGTMARFGLGYEELSREHGELVMLSTSLRGQTGPEAGFGAFGGQGAALAGLHSITGWPDRPPFGPWGAYTDFIAPRYGVAALAAAIYERSRSGLGQHIDLAQIEAAIHFLEPLLLEYETNGRVAGPIGHDSDGACPHGVYATRGVERYVALAVESAEQWRALRSVAPLEAFAGPRFDGLAERLARREEIDAALREWAEQEDPFPLAERLRAAGVPASVVLRPTDLYEDPQLAARRFFVTLDHSVMGPTPYDGPATIFSETPAVLRKAAPALGEDTHAVLRDLLGLTPDEVADYAAAGALA